MQTRITLLVCALCLAGGSVVAQEEAPPLPVRASTTNAPTFLAEYVVDGNPATRWASAARPGALDTLTLDLGASVAVERLSILWEVAHAVDYEVQVSDDGERWTTLARRTDAPGGLEALEGLGGQGRWLRINCLRTTPQFSLYSIWEITAPDAELQAALAGIGARMSEARALATTEARARLRETYAAASESVLFAVRQPGVDGHWYANFGYYAFDANAKCYRPEGGSLRLLNTRSGEVTTLFEDPAGSIRDPQLSYDGTRAVFSYLAAGTASYHLYEIALDGGGLRQLTDGDCDDIEPSYLPDGGIVFCSSRCNRWVNCWLTPVAVLYRCDADGRNVRPLSANIEQDNTPWPLPDGRVLYTRWEYVDRSQVDYHHLWTMNPDGTEQSVFFGNLFPGTVMIDAKPIPDTREILAVFSPGHGMQEHAGSPAIVDPRGGPDDLGRATLIPTVRNMIRDPYPLGPDAFLVADGPRLVLLDRDGAEEEVYRLPDAEAARGFLCHEPRLVAPRPLEPTLPNRVATSQSTGRLLLLNASSGRNMAGVQPGEIRRLLVMETLPKPINYTGGMDPLTWGGSFTLERIVGTVPVEEDGSAYFELPALRSFFFIALDGQDNTVKRMQSFHTVQPGEATTCIGCHEPRGTSTPTVTLPTAARRAPSRVEPVAGVPEVFDFPRDIQPILDRHCLSCHDYTTGRAGGVVLSGDHGPMFSHSYATLTVRREFVDGRDEPRSNLPPRSIGAAASPLMSRLGPSHYGVDLSDDEVRLVRYWIEAGAPYPGTYGALGGGAIGGYGANNLIETDVAWPEAQAAAEAIGRRCGSCHTGQRILPRFLSDECDVSFWRPDWNDPRLRLSRHLVFNLTRPAQSLMLLAPLAREAGGYGECVTPEGAPIFADASDPDYARILALCEAGKRRLGEIGRFDMPGFRPPPPYLREMVKYGVLPAAPAPDESVDPYALDRRYWQSLWYVPR